MKFGAVMLRCERIHLQALLECSELNAVAVADCSLDVEAKVEDSWRRMR